MINRVFTNFCIVCYLDFPLLVGANAVIKVEDTKRAVSPNSSVQIFVACSDPGMFVRSIGSDIGKGELVLPKKTVLGPTDIGLLATIGVTNIQCYKTPIIGVISTGSELVDPWIVPVGSQIRDSNRISLITSLQEDGHSHIVDLGIVEDTKELVYKRLVDASKKCDVVISSGGVSMGAKDHVKSVLNEVATVHFNKLKMKPGKPTTFATIDDTESGKRCLFFGLPGNPVSCLVTKSLFVDPAIRRLQDMNSRNCLHAQLQVQLTGEPIKLDAERPEYHRAIITTDSSKGINFAESTGFQRSSRLLSMRSANGLLLLPKGPGTIKTGATLTALLVRPIPSYTLSGNVHYAAANLDFLDIRGKIDEDSIENKESTTKVKTTRNDVNNAGDWRNIRVGLLTISDRASAGIYEDKSGPEMNKLLHEMSCSQNWPLGMHIIEEKIVPDNLDSIQSTILEWVDIKSPPLDLILTSGGTGFGQRDITPEAIKPILDREAPGVAQALLTEGLKYTQLAVLSRPVVGIRKSTFIATLPGSVKAVKENIRALEPLLPRIMELLKNEECSAN